MNSLFSKRLIQMLYIVIHNNVHRSRDKHVFFLQSTTPTFTK